MTTFFNLFDMPLQPANTDASNDVTEPAILQTYARKVNMRDYGYEQAGAHRGDSKALANLFKQIRNGRLIDESANEEQQQRNREALNMQILELEKEAEGIVAEQRKVREVQIPKAQAEIRGYDEQILQVRKDEASGLYKPGALNRFTLWKLGISVALLGFYLICFYISAVYAGMIRNIGAELENGSDQAKTLFANIFVPGAFSNLNFHLIAPILLLGFAVVLDIIYSAEKSLQRKAALILGILITFFLDALIAYKIEEMSQKIKALMGLADPSHTWWLSADFYIVLVMGFIATLAWGGIFYAFKKELGKKDTRRVVALEIAHFNNLKKAVDHFIFELKGTLSDLEGKMAKLLLDIKNLKERQKTLIFSKAELEKYINDFYNGWLDYLNGLSRSEAIKMECEAIREQFYQEHIDERPPITP